MHIVQEKEDAKKQKELEKKQKKEREMKKKQKLKATKGNKTRCNTNQCSYIVIQTNLVI